MWQARGCVGCVAAAEGEGQVVVRVGVWQALQYSREEKKEACEVETERRCRLLPHVYVGESHTLPTCVYVPPAQI